MCCGYHQLDLRIIYFSVVLIALMNCSALIGCPAVTASSDWLLCSWFFSLASLIRGQVLTKDGSPLVGVNVSFVKYPQYGYTLTRRDGT